MHQYSFYSATPYAIPFIAEILKNDKAKYKIEILGFLKFCAENSNRKLIDLPIFWLLRQIKGIKKQTLELAILSCHNIFKLYLNDSSKDIKQTAIWLDEFCKNKQLKNA